MRIEPEIAGVSLVMLGHFNPAILHLRGSGGISFFPKKRSKLQIRKSSNPKLLYSRLVGSACMSNQNPSKSTLLKPPMLACGTWLSEFFEKSFLIFPYGNGD